ncbi:hypothetical protein Airi01_099920 [Actinoallomurus iriomotensis]|uniref:Uncharacterized protein n=1 Tax=Actinoallomurus iriomotensis TaxID=478107 RepID=A0A9W6VVF1_9ACTN|nr:hypothetical protein Airi01_099920 [Actinoallomurus iriomotensis]
MGRSADAGRAAAVREPQMTDERFIGDPWHGADPFRVEERTSGGVAVDGAEGTA